MDDIKNLIQKSIHGLLSDTEQNDFEYKIDTNEQFRIQVLAELALMKYMPEPTLETTESPVSAIQFMQKKAAAWKQELKKRFEVLPYLENLIRQSQFQMRNSSIEMLKVKSPENNATIFGSVIFELFEVNQQPVSISIINNKSKPLISELIIKPNQIKTSIDISDWLPGRYYLIANVEGLPDFVSSFLIGFSPM